VILRNMKIQEVGCGEIPSALDATVDVCLVVMDFVIFKGCKGDRLPGVRRQ
jgi:hypothetical protein